MQDWPFSDAPNTAGVTQTSVSGAGAPLILVVHSADGDRSFLDGSAFQMEHGMLVGLQFTRGDGNEAPGPVATSAWLMKHRSILRPRVLEVPVVGATAA